MIAEKNRGKQFEGAINDAFKLLGGKVSIDRLKDASQGKKGVNNICDFTVFDTPFMYYFECKSTASGTLNFNTNISTNQWDGLLEKSHHIGVEAGYLIWFISYDINVFVPASELLRLKKLGKKSLSYKDILTEKVTYIPIPGKKKSILYKYDAEAFLLKLAKGKTVFNENSRRWVPNE